LFSSPYALEEARRNLNRKFPQYLDNFVTLQNNVYVVEHSVGLSCPEGLAQKDRPIFQAALACQATHLLTGDHKDFGPFMNQPENTFGIRIQTVAEFIDHLG
jgi:hypothetical protein